MLVMSGIVGCASGAVPSILLFDGTGTSRGDVVAIQEVLKDRGLAYRTANSSQLNAMSESTLAAYRLLIVPGGDFIAMAEHLTPQATARVHDAVHAGLNYVGMCGGAFLAARGAYNSVNLTNGVRFGFYAAESLGIHKAAVAIARPGAVPLDQYWEDGPE